MAMPKAHQMKDTKSKIIKLYNQEHSNVVVALKRSKDARFVRMPSS